MSPNSIDKITSKLSRLDEYLGYLKELSRIPRSKFIDDHRYYGLAERYLQLSIEICLDVGKLVLIERKLEKPESGREVFEILLKNKVISKAIFDKVKDAPGFRNILVHDYAKIDLNLVYSFMKKALVDLVAYKKAILRKI